MITVQVIQDGSDFYFESTPRRGQTVTAPIKVNNNHDVIGAREARTWFKDYCVKYGLIPVFI